MRTERLLTRFRRFTALALQQLGKDCISIPQGDAICMRKLP
jgi:hypothetical protein